MENGSTLWKTGWQHLKGLNVHVPYDPENLFLRVFPREIKTYGHAETCQLRLIMVYS